MVKLNAVNESLITKDELYYYDLMYELRKISGISRTEDKVVEERILRRIKATTRTIHVKGKGALRHEYRMSTFNEDLLEILREILRRECVERNGWYLKHSIPAIDSGHYMFGNECLNRVFKEVLSELEKAKSSVAQNPVEILQRKKIT